MAVVRADKRQQQLERLLQIAEDRAANAAEARQKLPAGTSRARVTSANARWASAAEERDRVRQQLEDYKAARKDGGT